MNRRPILFQLTIIAIVSGANLVSEAQQALLTHHVREVTRTAEAQPLARLGATESLNLDVVLALRHQPELQNFLQELYDPSSPSYRHFLTVPDFTARFGPSQEDYNSVIRFAKANGFTVTGGSLDSMEVQLRGSVSAVEKAFHVTMGVYRHPTENRMFYAPDREPSVDLPFQLWHISGLDNYSIPRPASLHKNATIRSNAVQGSCPGGYYCGSDMRAAYYGGTLTGTGQTVGLLEYLGYDIADLHTYFTNSKQTLKVPITGVSTDGSSLTCVEPACDDTEQILDVTQAVSMAPGLQALYVFVGQTDTALLASMSTRTPLVGQIGSSWTWEPADPTTDDPYFQKLAAQGQSYFQAAGDSGAYTTSSTYVYPGDDAYVTAVGGTALLVASAGGAWSSETAWSDGGGGVYTPDAIPIPAWQQLAGVITSANKGSTTLRNSPDVSAEANLDFYVCADQEPCGGGWGGTSFATPMWAGYMALVNQQAVANGNPQIGFINPAIYQMGVGSGYGTAFHDINSGSNGEPTTTGYDLATGWGSPNGPGLVNALAASAPKPSFTLSAAPNSLTVTQGNESSTTVDIAAQNAFTGSVTLSATGLPGGVTANFSPNPATTSSTLSLTASASAATGTVTVTVTGASSALTDSTSFGLTVNATSSSGAAVGLSPASLTWGNIKVGATAPVRTVTVRNTGTATLDISSITTSGDFGQKIIASSCGKTLVAKKACQIQVLFTPTETGVRTGTLTINDNAPNTPQTVPLTGTGK
jgi:kumamolisin